MKNLQFKIKYNLKHFLQLKKQNQEILLEKSKKISGNVMVQLGKIKILEKLTSV